MAKKGGKKRRVGGDVFLRERIRHPLQVRQLTVSRVSRVTSAIARVTLAGDDLTGFSAPGPADHVKVFFPDRAGELRVPTVSAQGKLVKGARPISRDYTPAAYRENIGELDLDFVLHGDTGPASAWAAQAQPGMRLGIAGPRGSVLSPEGVERAVLVGDETALPAISRWIDALTSQCEVQTLLFAATSDAASYFSRAQPQHTTLVTGADRETRALQALQQISFGSRSFVFLAGESGAIKPMRRYLREELELRKDQVESHGYWKRKRQKGDRIASLGG